MAIQRIVARVDVKVDFDKAFNFKAARIRAWNPQGAGDVKMARTKENDPEAVRKIAEPIIFDAVTREIGKRGLQTAQGAADLTLTYYLLLSTNMTAQTMGQFLPATTGWGLPPFAGATQSLEIRNQGSLVLEFSARGAVVRRGLAQPKMKFDAAPKQREALLREPAVTCCAASRRRHDRDQ